MAVSARAGHRDARRRPPPSSATSCAPSASTRTSRRTPTSTPTRPNPVIGVPLLRPGSPAWRSAVRHAPRSRATRTPAARRDRVRHRQALPRPRRRGHRQPHRPAGDRPHRGSSGATSTCRRSRPRSRPASTDHDRAHPVPQPRPVRLSRRRCRSRSSPACCATSCGYDGVVITDSLRMQGVREMYSDAEIPVLALKAGVDQLLMPPDLDARRWTRCSPPCRVGQAHRAADRPERAAHPEAEVQARHAGRAVRRRRTRVMQEGRHAGEPGDGAGHHRPRRSRSLANDGGLLPLKAEARDGAGHRLGRHHDGRRSRSTLTAHGTAATALPDRAGTDRRPDRAGGRERRERRPGRRADQQHRRSTRRRRSSCDALLATGKPVIAVAAQIPYDAGYVDPRRRPGSPPTAYIAPYRWSRWPR